MIPPNTSPNRSSAAPSAPKNGAIDGPGMWTPGGGTGLTLPFPRRLGPSVVTRHRSHSTKSTTRARMAIGISAINEPQSGVTNFAMRSRIEFQICSMVGIGFSRATDQPCGEPAART